MNTAIRKLSPELQEIAIREINEDPTRIEEEIEHIRDWLTKQPHLKGRTDSQWLLTFLRCCKHNMQKTKQKLDAFYTQRTLLPHLFTERDPFGEDLQRVIKLGSYLPLPNTYNGRMIHFYRSVVDEPKDSNVMYKMVLMILEILYRESDDYVINGNIIFDDIRHLSIDYSFSYIADLQKVLKCAFVAYPSRVTETILIGLSPLAESLLYFYKSITTEKQRSRIYTYSDLNDSKLYETLPKKYLPREYGGENGSLVELTEFWKEKLEKYRDYFKEEENYFSDESKRESSTQFNEIVFGEQGSFRNINID